MEKRLPLFDEDFSRNFLIPHIQHIAELVSAQINHCNQPGWMTGLAGMAIFLAEFEHRLGPAPAPDRDGNATMLQPGGPAPAPDHDGAGTMPRPGGPPLGAAPSEALAKIVELINEGFDMPTHAAGLGGIVWAFHYLGQLKLIDPGDAAALDELIPYIRRFSEQALLAGNLDALHGGTGAYISGVIEAHGKNGDAPAWPGLTPWPFDPAEVDLGLAHGLPSWVLFLEAIGHPELDQAIEKMLAFRKSGERSVFPTRVENGLPQFPSRLAWCYGDVGIGMAMVRLGRRRKGQRGKGAKVLMDVGIGVLEMAEERRDPGDTRVGDPYFCHGASGLAFMFYKAWVLSNNDKVRMAAQYWTRETIRMLESSHPAGKEYQRSGMTFGDGSLLNGLSGIGLSLLAITTDTLPGWESGLLI